MKKAPEKRERALPVSLILILLLAVLAPSVALSFLALRAADRESVYIERRLESALMAEVQMAARGVEAAMDNIFYELLRSVPQWAPDYVSWVENPLVGAPFLLSGGVLVLPAAQSAGAERFPAPFEAFLNGSSRLPVYDSVARIYRREAENPGYGGDKNFDSLSPSDGASAQKARRAAPKPPAQKTGGIARQEMESIIASAPEAREDAFRQASEEGFEIAVRNVAPQASIARMKKTPEAPSPSPVFQERKELSGTVSRSQSLGELMNTSGGGILPYLSENGLELLFWYAEAERIAGCSLRMEAVRDRVAEAMPEVLSEVRILVALDENGRPVSAVESVPEQDWRRPYVAREISPALPRWEVGAWLRDPEAMELRARYAKLAVLILVAVLFLVIAIGSAAAFRMVSFEMRIAAQKTTFVANVSHELKTPLTSIKLFAEILLSGRQTDGERRREYLRTMVSETDRLSRLVEDVLSFSKRDKNYPMQPLCLAELLEDALSQMAPYLSRRGFSVGVECRGLERTLVNGNREALRQVIMNMLSNAEKYSGDVLEISAVLRREGEWAILEIQDRGIGVEPRLAEKIFQEFFRGDDSLSAMRSGVGLGLSIARSVARRHGGDVRYSPRAGGGSVFSLLLPIYEEA
ncbi:MAG: HAMP domain-containing histidine kinase [Synergistaceae bacterium]|jgi:signal transduction histidine kinase|nr:HAMP domain-containing histidine kinase [Synergistaceae bacterium]